MNSLMMGMATLCAVAMIVHGVMVARRQGAEMYLSPRIFPVAYVACACLAPTYWIFEIGPLANYSAESIADSTPTLMAISVIAFSAGAAIKWRRVSLPSRDINPKILLTLSRLIFLFPLLLAATRYRSGYLATRGEGQDVRGTADLVAVAAIVVAPVIVLLIAVARRHKAFPFAVVDVVAISAFLMLQSLNGDRASSIGVLLAATCAIVSRPTARVRLRGMAVGMTAVVALSYFTSTYRTAQRNPSARSTTFAETVLQDLVSVPFTTGFVALRTQYSGLEGGSTLIAALIRQLPSPLAVALIGPVDDTGAFVFRKMVRLDDSQGLGFSIPAEGALNFGTWGVVGASFLYGAIMSWLFARASLDSGRAMAILYYVSFATLPFGWRADALGAIKGVLYSAIILALLLAVVRVSRTRSPSPP